ncbi:Panacea domain-containing protein [Mesorhizobium australicum]|uniref:Panacea domain-containing protein n=1 Tax=Mesorhizobium australicum TaxID=536018 RepID=UPI0033353840
MADLRNVMTYLIRNYPHKHELSKARLTKMIYLADWKSAIEYQRQMTDIAWQFNHFGPYVDDVHKTALEDPAFAVKSETNMFGKPKETITLTDKQADDRVLQEEAQILDHVIEQTKRLTWDPFIKLVYSTYPVLTGVRGAKLNLVKSAEIYRDIERVL